ncbi:TetR/AcrR family transcriptional regulator [Desnuesiella massiliensis]|uniref:TetR/AcrR family transcriptional regulator n=1 Tax=Desnuesiella massiliensis TaxID=1650662 RepID=UPI0006E371E4|nr:TetR/AcrR family transcriptional regulator [Desnuesiella massiliensis]
MNNSLDTRSKILQVAIDAVGLRGEITVRQISEKAGVNVAAINYHFGSKNNLLKEVENYYAEILYNMMKDVLLREGSNPKEKLVLWTNSLMEFMFKYPALIALIANLATEDREYNPILIQKVYLNEELENVITLLIKESTGIREERILKYKYLQIFSGILGPIIGEVVSLTYGNKNHILNISEKGQREEYINMLIGSIL